RGLGILRRESKAGERNRGPVGPRSVKRIMALPPPSAAAARFVAPTAASTARAGARTAAALGLGTRLVHVEGAALQLLAVQSVDRGLRLGLRFHFHKTESARLAAELVLQNRGSRDAPIGAERIEEVFLGDIAR